MLKNKELFRWSLATQDLMQQFFYIMKMESSTCTGICYQGAISFFWKQICKFVTSKRPLRHDRYFFDSKNVLMSNLFKYLKSYPYALDYYTKIESFI